ncbi:unnamed protein product [Linum tenue]|uniref:F-box/LRR-repeat protein 15/At3g58940/PEG3-like LRR domain-containing protein n=1 Tax=Linum tenue TaxID=586396 RepID=A0AAV0JMP8_9ROSI|nr:unnamed protein product [Linum tenue]
MKKQPMIDAAGGTDRISALPIKIIHNILDRLNSPVQVARTSALSRSWLQFWRSYPVLEFRHEDFADRRCDLGQKFRSFAASWSRRLLIHDNYGVPLDVFRISSPPNRDFAGEELTALLAAAAALAVSHTLSPIEIVVETGGFHGFPEGMLSNCSRTEVLKLRGCRFGDDGFRNRSVSLDSLRVLHLQNVRVEESVVRSFIDNAPRLESLRLESLVELERLEISVDGNLPNLKTLKIEQPHSLIELQLAAAPLLESLDIKHTGQCKLKVVSSSSAPSLRVLEFSDSKGFTESDLDDLISKLPSLESLHFVIKESCSNSRIRISSDKLQHFRIDDFRPMEALKELEIDAPNLVNLYYSRRGSGLLGKTNVLSVASNCQCVVEVCDIDFRLPITYEWFLGLRQFLTGLSKLHTALKLDGAGFFKQVSFDLSQADCTSPPPVVQHLQFGENSSYQDTLKACANLLDGLFWACRPQFVGITQRLPKQLKYSFLFSEYICGKLMNVNPSNCCGNGTCWRHQLKDVKIMNGVYGTSAGMMEISEDVFFSLVERKEVRYMFTWYQ